MLSYPDYRNQDEACGLWRSYPRILSLIGDKISFVMMLIKRQMKIFHTATRTGGDRGGKTCVNSSLQFKISKDE